MRWKVFIALAICLGPSPLFPAISEQEETPSPPLFLKSGERFTFPSADGVHDLSAIRFLHPQAKGTIVVLNGFSESWLKYEELFESLYQDGYSIISYDHRGLGLSPHFISKNQQIGHIDHFELYTADLDVFLEKVVRPTHPRRLYLIAHSMGGVVALEYLEHHPSPFKAIVLSSPMLRINTRPYPEFFAQMIVGLFHSLGFGRNYAPAQHDYDSQKPFKENLITSSSERWEAIKRIWKEHPEAIIGGPSNDWVHQSLKQTSLIRRYLFRIKAKILILQAGKDQLVINRDENVAHAAITGSQLIAFPDSKHEILMECDPIRNQAIREIETFFGN